MIEAILVLPLTHQLSRIFPVFPKMMKSGRFGASISVTGNADTGADTIAIGEPEENGETGVAFVYKKTGNVWLLDETFKPPNVHSAFKFGSSVSVSGDFVAISELGTSDSEEQFRAHASVYLFQRVGASQGWRLVSQLFASDGSKRDVIGAFVAMDDGRLATGSFNKWDSVRGNGPVYVFDVRDDPDALSK